MISGQAISSLLTPNRETGGIQVRVPTQWTRREERICAGRALLILDFVATWNEFAMALLILQDNSAWTLPLGLMSFQSQFQSDYGELNAAIVMTVLPATIVYLTFQRYFVSGLTSGAIRE